MIFVQPQPEPFDFDHNVRIPGNTWLSNHPKALSRDYPNLWSNCKDDLALAYRNICAYSAHWFPSLGGESVDHFIPKSLNTSQVYEWSNYRLSTRKMNSRKGVSTDVVDPFLINGNWFSLLFPALLVRPGPNLDQNIRDSVLTTINILNLNDEILIRTRLEYILEYCDGDITLQGLRNRAPFIAFELERQNLVDDVIGIFRRRAL